MANLNAPFGFRPVGELGSNIQNGGTSKYEIADNYGTAIYKGDIVQMAGGYVTVGTATSTDNLGIFNGCFYQDPTTQKPTWSNYYPGNVNITQGTIDAYVYDDPNKLFEVQMGGTATLAKADIGDNIDSVYTAGDSINGQSKATLAVAVTGGAATAQFRVVRISEDPENSDRASAYANYIVRFNEHMYYNRATGA
jgi:hypothetical protein